MSSATVIEPSVDADYYIEAPKPGLHRDVTFETYCRWSAINHSTLKYIEQSPLHARHVMLNPGQEKETKAKREGHSAHAAILEPERFEKTFGIMPNLGNRQSPKVRAAEDEFRAANPGVNFIAQKEYDLCTSQRDAVRGHSTAKAILSAPGANELSAVWKDSELGVLCKGRQDGFRVWSGSTLLDLKTAEDASPRAFSWAMDKYGYAEQAAFYVDAYRTLFSVQGDCRYVLIVVEKEPPFAVAVYELEQASIELGRKRYRSHLIQFARCLESGVWPAYGDGMEFISLPAKRFKVEGE